MENVRDFELIMECGKVSAVTRTQSEDNDQYFDLEVEGLIPCHGAMRDDNLS